MSVALRPMAVTIPELEINEHVERSVHYLEHGFPNPLVRWHCHDDYELHLIAASSGKVFVGDYVGSFSPGHLVLTGPRLPHNWISQIEPGESVELRDRVVQFRQDLISGMTTLAPELNMLQALLERSRYGIEFGPHLMDDVEVRLIQMRDQEGPRRVALLIEMLELLAGETNYTLLSTVPIRSHDDDVALDKIEQVTRYVTEHYGGPIALGDVAALVNMQESTFSRFFARSTGNGFNRFVNRMRISKACELLSNTELMITDICFEVGFKNVANFNRRFRELKTVTPREYRAQSRLRHLPSLEESDGRA